MARNGSGTYSIPNTMVAGTTITASDHNENYSDIGSEITNSVAADGQTLMTGPLKASNGTAAAPSHSFGSDTDTGIYRIGANNLGIAVGGTKIVDIASTGATVTGDVNATTLKQAGFALLPVGVVLPYGGSSAPSGYLLCYGQAISRTTYADLFAAIGTTYGTGDGSTTFNLPDFRGRVVAGKDDMGGSAASRLTSSYFGASGASLGSVGGSESHTLTKAQIPTGITSSGTNSISVLSTPSVQNTSTGLSAQGGGAVGVATFITQVYSTGDNNISVTSNNTSGNAHNNVQPTIILNYIIFAGV